MVDFNIDAGSPLKNGDIELLLQQIDILFDTYPKEVLGSEDFGTQYDDYLYRLKLSAANIKQRVISDISSLELFDFVPDVEVHLLQGTEKDIVLIDINLIRGEEKYNRTYKIS
jgi:hypothetical protein